MKRILVMDNDPSILMLYAEELGEEGYEVITSGDAAEAKELIAKHRPDLLVLDIGMGGRIRGEVLREARRRFQIPVLLCTYFPVHRSELRFLAAEGTVVKSSDLRGFKKKIKAVLRMCDHRRSKKSLGTAFRRSQSEEQIEFKWGGSSYM